MRKLLGLTVIFCSAILPLQNVAADDQQVDTKHDPLAEFFENSEAYVNFRFRYEFVDQDDLPNDAHATTLRSRLGLRTAEVYGLKGHIQLEDISVIGSENYNNTYNGIIDHPVVADPEGTEVNNLTLESSHIPDTTVLGGRYAKVLNTARFIGDVGWRQNNQTFDGATVENTSVEDLNLFYGYMWNVNRIFGDDSPMGDLDSQNHVFNATYTGIEKTTLAGYVYLLDLEDLAAQSSASYGGFATGAYPINDTWDLLFDGEYAFQTDYGDNATSYDAHYFRAGGGLQYAGVSLFGAFESLGSDDGQIAFSTPLATLHKFNGFADIFLNTPAVGLQDAYVKLGWTVDGIHEAVDGMKLALWYHEFTSDEGSTDFGTEWNADVVKKFMDKYYWGVRFAHYNADELATDTTKVIFSLGASFQTT